MQENLNKTVDSIKSQTLKEMQGVGRSPFLKNKTPSEIKWTLEESGGKLKINKNVSFNKTKPVSVASIDDSSTSVKIANFEKDDKVSSNPPNTAYLLGIRIDMDSKISFYKEGLRKNYILSKSHNVLVASFAKMKAGFYAGVLSFLGVKNDDLEDIKKEAKESDIAAKKNLFEENEYTAELLTIMGGSKKQIRKQKTVTDEIRNQIIKQYDNWGMGGFYTKDKIIEIQLEQCNKILEKFKEEKSSIEYQLAMFDSGISFDAASSNRDEISAKLTKIEKYVNKAEQRIASNQRTLNLLNVKKGSPIDDVITTPADQVNKSVVS